MRSILHSAMSVKPFLLIGLLFATTASAQGTFLYTWHGNSGLFQASFQVTAEENQPGQYFESQTFYNSIRFVSPDDTFTYIWPDDIAEGQVAPFTLSFILFDKASQLELAAHANSTAALMDEINMQSNSDVWSEWGHWTCTSVPEPSGGLLIALGAAVLGFGTRLRRLS